MPIPTLFTDLSTTASSNSPGSGETPAEGDNHLRQVYAFLRSIMANSGNGWTSPYVASSSLPTLASGTYMPTVTLVTNMTGATAGSAQYVRVGSIVHVFGALTGVDVTDGTSGALTVIDLSLPITSNLAAAADLNGVGAMNWEVTSTTSTVNIIANTTDDRASLRFFARSDPASTRRLTYSFAYTVA
jgi:hypothetical protein